MLSSLTLVAEQEIRLYDPPGHGPFDDTVDYFAHGITTKQYTATHAKEAVQDDFEELCSEYSAQLGRAAADWSSDAEPSQFHVGTAASFLHNGQDVSCTKESAFLVVPGPVARSCMFLDVSQRWNLHGDRHADRARA